VEELEKQVSELRQTLIDKQQQEQAMLKVFILALHFLLVNSSRKIFKFEMGVANHDKFVGIDESRARTEDDRGCACGC
jgi:hypothetical protein